MRVLAIFALFVFAFSCSSIPNREEEQIAAAPKKFMTPDEIRSEFVRLKNAKQMAESLSDAAKEREKTLIPDEKFVSPKKVKALKGFIESEKPCKGKKCQQASGNVDRRSCDNPAVSQCGGVCTSHGITNAMDNLFCKPNVLNSSNEDLWSKYRVYSTESGITAASKYKICEEKDWPNCGKKKSTCTPNEHVMLKRYKYLGNDIEAGKRALDLGHPLVYSGKVTKSWLNCDSVVNPKSAASGGGHAVAIVGYKVDESVSGGGYWIILNSWGKDCGDNGYQYLPFNYMRRTDNGMYGFAHEIQSIVTKYGDGGGNIDPDPTPPTPPNCKKVRYCDRCSKCAYLWNCCCTPWKEECE